MSKHKWTLDTVTRVLDFDTKSRAWSPRWIDVERPRITRANPDDRCRCGRH